MNSVASALLVLFSLYAIKVYLQFRRHLSAAKSSGIPYTVVPFYLVNRLWQVSHPLTLPILRRLPSSWTEPWLPLSVEWGWTRRYAPFANMGADTFLSVSPEKIVLNSCEASVISQITQRRNDFPKALEVYGMLEIYGRNMVTTEGNEWRHQRKITNPSFNEANNHLVWQETLLQARDMVGAWLGDEETRSPTLTKIGDDAMRLSLHVISKAGFGVHLTWPGSTDSPVREVEKLNKGHKMSYTEALGTLLEHIIPVLVLPKFLLRNLPFQSTRVANQSYEEWNRYMWEMFNEKKAQVLDGRESKSNDLMMAMLKGAGLKARNGDKEGEKSQQTLTDQEIIGNAFVFILAGHETTANSIHFCLAFLAMNIPAQRCLQRDLDEIFRDKPVNEWDYERYIGKLFGGWAGAVMNEELRLVPPVTSIPKCTEPGKPQQISIKGKNCIVPDNTYISLMPHCAHRNPNQWPTGPPADSEKPSHPYSNHSNDLEEFKPSRWFKKTDSREEARLPPSENVGLDLDNPGVSTAPDISPKLYSPAKGAYVPFSEGFRSCIGRRFAQVELLAFLAYVFSQYTIELSVEEWASDEQLKAMSDEEKRDVWEKARAKIEHSMTYDMFSIVTLQLRKGHFALRLVKRGSETFDWD